MEKKKSIHNILNGKSSKARTNDKAKAEEEGDLSFSHPLTMRCDIVIESLSLNQCPTDLPNVISGP